MKKLIEFELVFVYVFRLMILCPYLCNKFMQTSMEFYLNVISKVKQKCFHCLLLFKWLYSTHTYTQKSMSFQTFKKNNKKN